MLNKAIGMVEYQTVSSGITAADLMVKTANVEVLQASVVCPGKYIIIISGELSAISAARLCLVSILVFSLRLGCGSGIQRFRQRTDLIRLDQNSVCKALPYALRKQIPIGHEKIVTHKLNAITESMGKHLPALPIGLTHTVLERDNGIFIRKIAPRVDKLFP